MKRLERATGTSPYTDKSGQLHLPVSDARAHGQSWGDIERQLRDKDEILRSPDYIARGKQRWLDRDQMLDPAFYWYHRS